MFGKKKHQQILALFEEHTVLVRHAVNKYEQLLVDYVSGDRTFKKDALKIHELESKADKVRFNVEYEMYKGAFLPTQREDYILVLETLDRVANKAEECGDFITLVQPPLPEMVADDIRTIARETVEQFQRLEPLLNRVLGGDYDIRHEVKEIGRAESRVDKLQFDAVHRIYESEDISKLDKLLCLMTFNAIGAVSDRIENVGDKLSLIAIKRKLA